MRAAAGSDLQRQCWITYFAIACGDGAGGFWLSLSSRCFWFLFELV